MTAEEPTMPNFPTEAPNETLVPQPVTVTVAEPEPPAAQVEPPSPPVPAETMPARRGVPIWVWILLALGLVAILCCCCSALAGVGVWATSGLSSSSLTPGINSPTTVEGIQVQVTSVTRKSSYVSGTRTYTPSQPGDDWLLVEAKVSGGDVQTFHSKWQVYITDENGRRGTPSITTTTYSSGGPVEKVTWIIAASKTSRAFVLHLPGDQTINLSSLVR